MWVQVDAYVKCKMWAWLRIIIIICDATYVSTSVVYGVWYGENMFYSSEKLLCICTWENVFLSAWPLCNDQWCLLQPSVIHPVRMVVFAKVSPTQTPSWHQSQCVTVQSHTAVSPVRRTQTVSTCQVGQTSKQIKEKTI